MPVATACLGGCLQAGPTDRAQKNGINAHMKLEGLAPLGDEYEVAGGSGQLPTTSLGRVENDTLKARGVSLVTLSADRWQHLYERHFMFKSDAPTSTFSSVFGDINAFHYGIIIPTLSEVGGGV